MYVLATYNYVNICTCLYMNMNAYTCIYMYVHASDVYIQIFPIMYIPGVRIPDVWAYPLCPQSAVPQWAGQAVIVVYLLDSVTEPFRADSEFKLADCLPVPWPLTLADAVSRLPGPWQCIA